MENTENDAKFIEINPLSKEFFTREFQKKNFFFNADKPSLIGSAQNERFQKFYIAFRGLYVVYYCARLIFLATYKGKLPFLLYLYSWSATTQSLTHILHFICSIHLHKSLDKEKADTPTLYKVTWLIYTLSLNITTLGVFLAEKELCDDPGYLRATRFFDADWELMIGLSIYLINLLMSGVPVRLFHFYPTIIFGLAFVTIINVYWAVTGEITCKILNRYHHGTVFAVMIGLYVPLCVCVHLYYFLIYWMRLLMYKYLCCCCYEVMEEDMTGNNIDTEENVEPTEQEAVV